MNIFNKLFDKRKPVDTTNNNNTKVVTLKDFINLPGEERMLTLMKFGDRQKADSSHFPFFQFAILSDPDKNVKFVA